MFKTLLIKEWKDKAPLVAFGLGIMALMLAAFLVLGDDQDLRELIPATFLIFFFPVIGAMLGAGAFESEFRDGAWTYLLSRPVRKETIWLAKLVASLSILAGSWLLFIGLLAVAPGLEEVVSGLKLPDMLGSGLALFPLILLSSLFFLSIAFSLSILTDKPLSLVFGSLFLGFVLEGVLFVFAFLAQGRAMLTQSGRFPMLGVFNLGLVLSSLAFLAASLLTWLKADFSQSRIKTGALARWCLLFLAAAWALSAAWPALRPGPKEEIGSIEVVGNEAVLSTSKGLYHYELESGRFRKIVRLRLDWGCSAVGGGKVLYVAGHDLQGGFELWVANTDGSDKRLLWGSGRGDMSVSFWPGTPRISPDGKTAVFAYEETSETSPRSHVRSLASIGTEGRGLKKLAPLDPVLAGEGEQSATIIRGWLGSPDGLLMWARPLKAGSGPRTVRTPYNVWRYDLASGAQIKLFESPGSVSLVPNPAGNMALLISEKDQAGPIDISLLDLKTGTTTPISTIERPGKGTPLWSAIEHSAWSGDGDRVGFLIHREGHLPTPAVYSGKDRRLVMGPGIRLQESPDLSNGLAWIGDGTKLAVTAVRDRSIYVLGPDLALEKTVPVPPSVNGRFRVWPVGAAVLLTDQENQAIWRLDLKTDKWKRIW